jgi:hypothetical protein
LLPLLLMLLLRHACFSPADFLSADFLRTARDASQQQMLPLMASARYDASPPTSRVFARLLFCFMRWWFQPRPPTRPLSLNKPSFHRLTAV